MLDPGQTIFFVLDDYYDKKGKKQNMLPINNVSEKKN